MEDLLYQALVDVVFAGHVHTYDRFGSIDYYYIITIPCYDFDHSI